MAMIEKAIVSVLKQTRLPFILGQGEIFEDLSQIEQSFGKAGKFGGCNPTGRGKFGIER